MVDVPVVSHGDAAVRADAAKNGAGGYAFSGDGYLLVPDGGHVDLMQYSKWTIDLWWRSRALVPSSYVFFFLSAR